MCAICIRTGKSSLNSRSHGVDLTLICPLMKRAHTFCMMFMRSWYSSFGFLKESNTTTRAWSISIESKIQWKLLIHKYGRNIGYILIVKLKWWKMSKESLEVATRWMYKCDAYPRPWIYYSWFDLAISLHCTPRLRYPVLILTLAKNVHLYQDS